MKKVFYAALMWFMRLTWGLLDTIIGLFIFLFFRITHRHLKIGIVANTIVVELPHQPQDSGWGLSSGLFIFSNTNSIWNREYLLFHEFGHSWPQLLVCGPLHPFLVLIPSFIRFWWREHQYSKGNFDLPPYDSVWFEGTATTWGTKWFKWGLQHGLWS